MSLPRCGRLTAAGFLIALLATACGGAEAGEETTTTTTTTTVPSTTTTTIVPAGPLAPLTALPLGDREELLDQPAIMVKISNNDSRSLAALVGLEQADVVIEERIEDRATRFAAIFHTNRPALVGPVRSARPADIDLMANLGTPMLVFSGAFVTVLSDMVDFAGDGGAVLVVDDGSGVDLFRDDENFDRPDNLFVDLQFVFDKYGGDAGVATPIFEYRLGDTTQSSNSGSGVGFTVEGRDKVSFVWDPDRGYVRVQDGVVHVTREGVALVTDNLVVMETVYTASSYDPRNVDALTTGSGPVSVMAGGRRGEGTWSRETAADPYTFLDLDGNQAALADYRDKKNVVLVFTRGYPGYLCLYCMTQTSRLITNYDQFEGLDAEVLVVFPGNRQDVQKLIHQSKSKAHSEQVPFPILLDEEFRVVDAFGIRGNLAKPATYIFDKQGGLRFAYVGETISDRPSIKALLKQLEFIAQ